MPKPKLDSLAPDHLKETAKKSGLFHCRKCRLVWFGKPGATTCPEGPHGRPVHVVLLCRSCDLDVPIKHLATHLSDPRHLGCVDANEA